MSRKIGNGFEKEDVKSYSVSIEACPDYSWPNIKHAIEGCVDRIGGFKKYVKPGERVLLKPNLLAPRAPETAVCTHPEVARAAIQLVREAGGKPFLGDSPGGRGVTRRSLEKQHMQVFEISGLAEVARQEGVEFVLLDGDVELVPNPAGSTFMAFPLSSSVTGADAIINLARFKTHMQTQATAAVKNMYGCIPGQRKMEYHFTAGKAGMDVFADMLIDLNFLVKPRLTVLDAVIAHEGPGPATGEPRPLKWLAASDDTFALDMVACSLTGLEPDYVPTIRRAVERGIGPKDIGEVKVLGEPIGKLAVDDLVRAPPPPPPRKKGRSRLWYLRMRTRQKFLARTYRVPPSGGKDCDACGACVEACPVDVAEIINGRARLGGEGCIRCWGCAVACKNNLVSEKPSFMARMIN